MFSGVPNKSKGHATSYFDEHLSQNDYYNQGQTQAGHWIGVGSDRLGIPTGRVVTREAFLRLCGNQYPVTGEQITPQQFQNRRIFFDFVCSAPKSVSILGVTLEDDRIVQAHREASELALRELERFAGTRVRTGGVQEENRTTGNVVGAAFLHTASRALDPQLHTHFVVFNCSWDDTEMRWKALQTGEMFGALNYATAVYRNELAARLRRIGYGLRPTNSGFEIEGVDPALIERFSKRSKQRDIAVKRAEEQLGRKLTKKEIAHIVHRSRPRKVKGASPADVRNQQLGELGFFERRGLRKIVRAANRPSVSPLRSEDVEGKALHYAVAHVFERQSVVREHKILEAALVKECGQLDLPALSQRLRDHPDLVSVGSEYSTRDILQKELYLIRTVDAGVGSVPALAPTYQPSKDLGTDQQEALRLILHSPDRITGFRGRAGTGKSTTLLELARALRDQGHDPVFCAPTTSAVEVLRAEGLRGTVTLQSLLSDPAVRRLVTPRSVVILDEAGTAGLDDMVNLFELSVTARCRVVLSGDTRQHGSVPRGDALRIIEEHSRYRFGQLLTIRRQKQAEYRAAVDLAADGRTDEAFRKLEEMGVVTEVATEQGRLYDRVAEAYQSASRAGKSALIVSPTWSEIDAVTEKVREGMRKDGEIADQDDACQVFDSLSWTQAQKQDPRIYERSHRIRFVRPTREFKPGEIVEVTALLDEGLRVRHSDGAEVDFRPQNCPAAFDVGEARELKVAPGDWLLLRANDRSHRLTNGERVQVRSTANGTITLTDGRVIPNGYRTFTHGYAVTSHASQGKTVDEVLVVASSKSFPAVSQEQFYVSISRGRERCQIFTDDKELLAERITGSRHRRAAVELAGLHAQLAKMGFVRPGAPIDSQGVPSPRRRKKPTPLMAPASRLVEVRDGLVRWLRQRLGLDPKPSPELPDTSTPTSAVPAVTTRRSTRTVARNLAIRRAIHRSIGAAG